MMKKLELKLVTTDIKAEKIKEDFALEVLYQEHKDIVLELIQKERFILILTSMIYFISMKGLYLKIVKMFYDI